MKTTKLFFMAALALMTAACSNDDNDLTQQPVKAEGIPFTATISLNQSATTRALTENGTTIEATWATGEKVALIYTVSATTYLKEAEVTPQGDGTATISTTLDGSPVDDTDVTIVYPASAVDESTKDVKTNLLASQNGLLTGTGSIAEKYELRKTTTPAKLKIDGTTASLKGTVALTNQFAIVKFSLTDGYTAIKATQFVIKDGSDNVITTVTPTSANSELYVAMQPATASAFKFVASDANFSYSYTKASATLVAGIYYQSPIALSNLKYNPLWWVAQYNMAEGGASFVTSHSTESQYCFNWTDACAEAVAYYHLPTFAEQISIFPCDKTNSNGTNIFDDIYNSLSFPKEFSEVACTVGGSSVSANTSVIGRHANQDYYAVRFIGTQYASAWHYKYVTSPCNGLLIESYLIPGSCADLAAAKTILAGITSSTIFTGSANATNANQTPENTTVTIDAFTQRFLPACGQHNDNGNYGSGSADFQRGTNGYYWSATEKDSSNGWLWNFNSNRFGSSSATSNLYERNVKKDYAFSVRLFRDN